MTLVTKGCLRVFEFRLGVRGLGYSLGVQGLGFRSLGFRVYCRMPSYFGEV